tara:strand:- start:422 stop:847 length:426 start_codon:yes stop_codon:yes gene_type:complete
MSKVVVDTTKQYAPQAPEGAHLAIITKAVFSTRPDDAKFNPGLNQVTWHMRWDDPDLTPEINGTTLREDTCVEDYKNAAFCRFMKGLNLDASGFEYDDDTSEVKGIGDDQVLATVRHTPGKLNEDGERPMFAHVVNVTQPE